MINIISEGNNHKAINIGTFDTLYDYSFNHPKLGVVKNKLFLGRVLESTGSEISFMELTPKTTIAFLHKHKKHEEIYIFLKGYGQFQIDNSVFKINEGSIVRVSPNGIRTLRNDSENGMIYMVIQSTVDTLTEYNISDGYIVDDEIMINV